MVLATRGIVTRHDSSYPVDILRRHLTDTVDVAVDAQPVVDHRFGRPNFYLSQRLT